MKKFAKQYPKTLYFDYASTAPITKVAKEATDLAYSRGVGNPGSIHRAGMRAVSMLDNAREIIAGSLGGEFNGTIFTSSATEANNLILKGVVKRYVKQAKATLAPLPARVIISSAEHESIEKTADALSEEGVEVLRLPVLKNGKANLTLLEEAINSRTVIVSLIFTGNETGAINDIRKASKIISNKKKEGTLPLFHIDASQSLQYEDCSFLLTGADVMTLSSHKIGGPKGAGALIFRNSTFTKLIDSQLNGGGQEFGMRSGTENVPAIAGFAVAVREAINSREKERRRVLALKEELFEEVVRIFPKAKLNGPKLKEGSPHILNVWLPNVLSETLVMAMDVNGVAISYGSACSARAFKPSRAILSLGYSESRARESIRISIGKETTREDIRKFGRIMKKVSHSVEFSKAGRPVA
jgi:cysteine desulfurase